MRCALPLFCSQSQVEELREEYAHRPAHIFTESTPHSTAVSAQVEKLREEYHIDLRVLGIAGASGMLLHDTGLDLATWKEDYQGKVRARRAAASGAADRGAARAGQPALPRPASSVAGPLTRCTPLVRPPLDRPSPWTTTS